MKTFRSGDEEVFLRIGRVRLVDVVDWESSQFSDDVMRKKGGRGLGVFFRINESSRGVAMKLRVGLMRGRGMCLD